MPSICAGGFHLEREFSPTAAFNCRTTGSNGSGTELFEELESNSSGKYGGASIFMVSRSMR